MIILVRGMSHARLEQAAAQLHELPKRTGAERFRRQVQRQADKGTCAEPDCGRAAYCRGLCSAHYIHDYRRRRWPRRYAK